MFRHKEDRILTTLFVAYFGVDLIVFFTAESVWFVVFWMILGILPKAQHPGSLTWVCEILQLQPWMLRQWLSVYHQSHHQKREHMVMELFRSLRPSMN